MGCKSHIFMYDSSTSGRKEKFKREKKFKIMLAKIFYGDDYDGSIVIFITLYSEIFSRVSN